MGGSLRRGRTSGLGRESQGLRRGRRRRPALRGVPRDFNKSPFYFSTTTSGPWSEIVSLDLYFSTDSYVSYNSHSRPSSGHRTQDPEPRHLTGEEGTTDTGTRNGSVTAREPPTYVLTYSLTGLPFSEGRVGSGVDSYLRRSVRTRRVKPRVQRRQLWTRRRRQL